MRITQITINFTETCNLGDYSNTKPSIELTALLDAGDDVYAVVDSLTNTAKGVLRDKIDDELERVNRPVKYFDGPRYDVLYGSEYRCVAIVPHGYRPPSSSDYSRTSLSTVVSGVRYLAALRRADQQLTMMPHPCRLFDCRSGGGLSPVSEELIAHLAQINQQIAEKQQREKEERDRKQAEWEAKRRQMTEVEEDDDFDNDNDGDVADEEFYPDSDSSSE